MARISQHIMAVGKFKAECLREIENIQQTGEPLIVTKRGKPIVKIIPIFEEEQGSFFGCMKNTFSIEGDIMAPIEDHWNIDEGNI
jgi:antitoxin (DNA-binding transcriptional repressor) of toxin-antitoxin stability system